MFSDHPNEACGVFELYAPGEDEARVAFFRLYTLQHRGQESAGIAVSDGTTVNTHKAMGLVSQVFDEGALAPLQGHNGKLTNADTLRMDVLKRDACFTGHYPLPNFRLKMQDEIKLVVNGGVGG